MFPAGPLLETARTGSMCVSVTCARPMSERLMDANLFNSQNSSVLSVVTILILEMRNSERPNSKASWTHRNSLSPEVVSSITEPGGLCVSGPYPFGNVSSGLHLCDRHTEPV